MTSTEEIKSTNFVFYVVCDAYIDDLCLMMFECCLGDDDVGSSLFFFVCPLFVHNTVRRGTIFCLGRTLIERGRGKRQRDLR